MSSQLLQNDNCPLFAKLTELIPDAGIQLEGSEDDESLYNSVPEFCLDFDSLYDEKNDDSRERSGSGLSAMTQSSLKDYSAHSTNAETQVEHQSETSENNPKSIAFSSFIHDGQDSKSSSELELEMNALTSAEQDPALVGHFNQTMHKIANHDQSSKFQVEMIRHNEFVSTISKLIDHQPLRLSDIDSLDNDQLILLSNFTKMLFDLVLNSQKDLVSQLEELNSIIKSAPEKKKRNEERIKFTFKRANKLLLKRFVQLKQLESLPEEDTQALFIEYFFGTNKKKANQEFQKLEELIFKPRNIYRRELKELFQHQLYTEELTFTLESLLYDEYLQKRRTKILSLCDQIKEELYYRNDKSSASVLQKILKRMPWSAQEAKKGLDLMLEIITSS
jgi:hypothetical protein